MQRLKNWLHLAPEIKRKPATLELIAIKFAHISTLKIQPALEPQPLFPNEWHWTPSWVWISHVSCCSFCACIVQHINFNQFFHFFGVFYKNVLAARVRSMVAKGACMQTFENDLFWLLKETENMQFWGTKSALCPPRAVQKIVVFADWAENGRLGKLFICIKLAIERLSDPIFIFRLYFFTSFIKMCSPPTQEPQFWI